MSRTDKAAFEQLIEPHFDRLYRLAYRFTNNRADAEDLIQDLLIKLYQRRAELSSIQDLSPWLGRVLYNQFIDGVRSYGRSPLKLVDGEMPDIAAETGDPLLNASSDERLRSVARAVERLSEEHRIVLLMHDAEGYTLAEIETLTGTPLGTCKSRLHRARTRLRELVASASGTPQDASAAEPPPAADRGAPPAVKTRKKSGTFFRYGSCR